MEIVVAGMVVTALWLVLGGVLHGGHDVPSDVAGQAWWWEACDRSPGALPPSHPLARLRELPPPDA
jgi:hypothetical protein